MAFGEKPSLCSINKVPKERAQLTDHHSHKTLSFPHTHTSVISTPHLKEDAAAERW